MSKIEVDAIDKQSGSTLTLGGSGTAVTLACGATQTGFGRTGTVNWVTTKKTTSFTAVSGEGYFCDTAASGAFTLTLPASPSAGDIVGLKDYNGNFATANLTIGRNSQPINGGTAVDVVINTAGASIFLVYVDASQGWVATQDDSSTFAGETFVTATGGNNVVTCGNFKTHIFTGPGTFAVSAIASSPADNKIDYLVVAGGGSGGWTDYGAGGGAGGFRMANSLSLPAPTTSPLANPTGLTATVASFPITVGAGGSNPGNPGVGATGSNSIFSTITSTGGGGGVNSNNQAGQPGGSGGGGMGATAQSSGQYAGGTGNTPPVSPSQGNPGGSGYDGVAVNTQSGSGGGAGAAGGNAGPGAGAVGGVGSFIAEAFIGPTAPSFGTPGPELSTRYFAGGGGGATDSPNSNTYAGGAGGGGLAGSPSTPEPSRPGTINTGGGAGGGANGAKNSNGGSGIVMIRYKYQ
jgi:hypothetical protein